MRCRSPYSRRVTSPLETLAGLFAGEGMSSYLGEEVSIAAHMLQAAALAEKARAGDYLVAAALLHDVGHFEAITPRQEGKQHPQPRDFRHQETGATWLAQWFPEAVTEPVRLHVMAKRYLCRIDPVYFERLSQASVHTLSLQGGPLTTDEARLFKRLSHAANAVAVRRWDDDAKDPSMVTPSFDSFRALLDRVAR